MTDPQFYLAINLDAADSDESTAAYLTEGAAMMHLEMAGYATHIFLCTPSENRMRDVTEDLARKWWSDIGFECQTIPNAYVPFLEDVVAERDNADFTAENDAADHWWHSR